MTENTSENKEKKNPAVWELSSTNPELAEKVKEGLRDVRDPEMGYSVIDLGLIRNVKEEDGKLHLTMILTTPFCPYGSVLVEGVRLKTEQVTAMTANVELSFDPWDFSMMEDGCELGWGF